MGPRYRLGTIPDEPRLLKPNQEVVLGPEAHDVDLPVDPRDPGRTCNPASGC